MRSASLSIGAGLVLALATSSAVALGFGPTRHQSSLGQPLDFSVPLRFDEGEFVAIECINATVVAGEHPVPASAVRLSMESGGQPSERRLRVRTSSIIDEPIVQITLSVGCPTQLTREFAAFIDPPALSLAEAPAAPPPAAPASAAAAAPDPGFVAAAPAPRAAAPAPAASAPARPRPRPRPPPVVRPPAELPVTPPTAAAPRPASEVVKAVPAAPAATGPRLRLDPAEGVARRAPAKPASAVAAAPASAPAAEAAPPPVPAPAAAAASAGAPSPVAAASQAVPPLDSASALARQAAAALQTGPAASDAASAAIATAQLEQQKALEARLEQMTREAQATRDSIAALQARVREAEASRYSNPLVYGLGGLALGLLAALGFLFWWSRERERQREAWWMAAAGEARQRQARGEAREHDSADDADEPQAAPAMASAPLVEIEPRTPQPGPVTWKPTFAIPELDTKDVPHRAVTAEELIDLGQQVEFFITLGQDGAALDLLEGHIASAGASSPLPFLKLLEMYHQRGEREAYERVREAFRQRFDASAPAWGESGAAGRPLEDQPQALVALQEAWPTPARAMGVIESLMFRRGEADPVFGLEACSDLLFLYEIARDLGEPRDGPLAVDLELPLEIGGSSVFEPAPVSSPMPLAGGRMSRSVSVDVDLDASQEDIERKFERSARYEDRDFSFGTGSGPLDDEPPASRPPRERHRR